MSANANERTVLTLKFEGSYADLTIIPENGSIYIMSSTKRKAAESQLHRRVRARRELSEELEDVAALSESSSTVDHDAGEGLDNESPGEEEEGSNDRSESVSPISKEKPPRSTPSN